MLSMRPMTHFSGDSRVRAVAPANLTGVMKGLPCKNVSKANNT